VAHLQDRYGATRLPPALTVAIGVVVVTFVGWVIWAGLGQANQDLRWTTTGFSDVSATSVTVEFDVLKPAGTDVVCVVRALDDHGVEVGRAEVPVASDGSDVHVVYALPVTARPSSALADSCRTAPETDG
jgi:hypothetical protein